MNKIKVTQAIVVEGRDDVDAVSRACEALIIPTHGFGITKETWGVIEKAYNEKGLIILTDPDLAGERIRNRLTERFPEAVQCYMTQADTMCKDDIGIENARPEAIGHALARALELSANIKNSDKSEAEIELPKMQDLVRLGLAGGEGSSGLRADVCRRLGIGYGNAKAMLGRLAGFRIGIEELEETVKIIQENRKIKQQ